MSAETHVCKWAVWCNGRKGGWGLAFKFVNLRSPSFYNASHWVPRKGWTKVASLVIWGEEDSLLCPFPQKAQQCPLCSGGREVTAKALPAVSQHSTTGTTLISTACHTDCPVHKAVRVSIANPVLSAGFPISSHYTCSNFTIPTFILLQWGFLFIQSPVFSAWPQVCLSPFHEARAYLICKPAL